MCEYPFSQTLAGNVWLQLHILSAPVPSAVFYQALVSGSSKNPWSSIKPTTLWNSVCIWTVVKGIQSWSLYIWRALYFFHSRIRILFYYYIHIFILLSENCVFHIAFNFWKFSLISLVHLIIGTVFGDLWWYLSTWETKGRELQVWGKPILARACLKNRKKTNEQRNLPNKNWNFRFFFKFCIGSLCINEISLWAERWLRG